MAQGSVLGHILGETGSRRGRGQTQDTGLRDKDAGQGDVSASGKWSEGLQPRTAQRAVRRQQLASEVLTGLELRPGSHWHTDGLSMGETGWIPMESSEGGIRKAWTPGHRFQRRVEAVQMGKATGQAEWFQGPFKAQSSVVCWHMGLGTWATPCIHSSKIRSPFPGSAASHRP